MRNKENLPTTAYLRMIEINIMILMIRSLKAIVTQNTGFVLLTVPANPDNIIPNSHTFNFFINL